MSINGVSFEEVLSVLGREGSFSKIIEDYEFRPEQTELSEKITEALNEDKILLAEAGTGVGKTMAYLIPGIKYALTHGPVIISTNTINLQSQLMDKDIPDAAKAMPEEEFRTAVAKGRGNYVCLSMVDDAHNNLILSSDPSFEKLKRWIRHTREGDYQDLGFPFPEWQEVASNIHTCKKEECPYKQTGTCFYYRMQQKLLSADIIITNHALFFSDLAAKSLDPYGGILPREYSAVIFDEAHHIEDAAAKVFGEEFSSFSVPQIIRRLKNRQDFSVDQSLLKEAGKLSEELFENIKDNYSNDYFLSEVYSGLGETTVKDYAAKIKSALVAVGDDLDRAKSSAEKDTKLAIDRYASMTDETVCAINEIFFAENKDKNFTWGETRPGDRYSFCSLYSTPIDVAEILQDSLFSLGLPIIMTSATLSTSKKQDGFDYIRKRLGLPEDTETVSLDAPFDYMKNSLLYVPKDLPYPNSSPEYTEKITDYIKELIDYAEGNAFVLFTSRNMMINVYDRLCLNLKYQIIRQGEMSNEELIKQFRNTERSVLFGVSSFWEGIDVKGDRLKLVVIDKIPFPVPTSPTV
ncbi:MAG: ATP-dependent DNA helicase, partial [Armatimonadetes bacterium]|nr:ATP-dependent DNA helicase [Candidatus Hippobium faecium]